MSLLLYYVFAAVAKWEGDKCNYQFFLWSLLAWENARTFTEERCAMACITGTKGRHHILHQFPKSNVFGRENKSIWCILSAQFVVKKMKIGFHYVLLHMFFWSWKCFHGFALNHYFVVFVPCSGGSNAVIWFHIQLAQLTSLTLQTS